MNAPKVSVVIPTYNRSRLLVRAVDSVLQQTYQDFEILIVDDHSTDDTKERVAELSDGRIIYVHHDGPRGGSAARNTGIKNASGEYIAFLDSDDEWYPVKMEKQSHLFADPSIDISYTGFQRVDQVSGKAYETVLPRCGGNVAHRLWLDNCVGTTSTVMMRKKCLLDVGGFDESLPQSQDWDLWIRLADKYRFAHVDEVLLNYYTHDGEQITKDKKKHLDARLSIFNKYRQQIISFPKAYSYHCAQIGALYCACGNILEGRCFLRQSVRAYPWNVFAWTRYAASLSGRRGYLALSRLLQK